ncbi:hypothetical protein EUGRSUZ_F00230 [Eucalyptus grandis]|uniref:Uncharacterized protein n=2 Tax=Eucalyptus grandis TaxID=71139 RepID=A0ACC3KAY2_EUCGR|nr:hypothetical protein EUGRSUZ_F00230 [Eucalyptus grandis]
MNSNLWKGERAKLYNPEMNFDDLMKLETFATFLKFHLRPRSLELERISLQNFNQRIIAKQANFDLHKFQAHTHIEFNTGKQTQSGRHQLKH